MIVYIVEMYDPDADYENMCILNVFASKGLAEEWLEHYIDSEEGTVNCDFSITAYGVLE